MNTPELAQRALEIAVTANTKIEEHERTCAARWAVVVKTNFVMVGTLLTVLGVLTKVAFFSTL